FFGTINATIDAEGSGEYAELDDQGRYKVRFPFDLSGRDGGKASHWVRMAQPYAGTDHGMHFPLHKGTEVLLTFIEGDPDRPIIAGAVPNPEKPSVIQDETQTKAAITTSGQNKIHFEDQQGIQRILLQSPTKNSWIRIGSPWGWPTIPPIPPLPSRPGKKSQTPPASPALEDVDTGSDGIRWRSDGKMWTEAMNLTGDYITGTPTDAPATVQGMIDDLKGFSPESLRVHNSETAISFPEMLSHGHVTVEAVDTVNLQYGNAYDFGGYWNYNLGNSYAEDHISQTEVELNAGHSKKFPSRDKLTGIGSRVASGVLQGAAALAGGGAGLVLGGVVMGVQQGLAETAQQREVGDAVESGGPQVGDTEKEIETEEAKVTGMTTGNTWVEKKFGNSYSYAEGDSIDISHGNTEEHSSGNSYSYTYGGTHEETKISGGGIRTAWSKSGGGVSEEKTWDKLTGNFMSYEYKNHGHFTFSTQFPRPWPTLAISMSMENIKGSISFSAGVNFSADFKLAANFSFTAAVASDISLIFAPAGKIEIKNLEVDADFFGFKFKSNPPVDVETELTKIKSGQATIAHESMILKSKVNELDNSAVKLDTVYTLHMMS
ncbi:MAG: phage baseplate assembly protein V, partial [Thermodesulfobacteriota bacterium]